MECQWKRFILNIHGVNVLFVVQPLEDFEIIYKYRLISQIGLRISSCELLGQIIGNEVDHIVMSDSNQVYVMEMNYSTRFYVVDRQEIGRIIAQYRNNLETLRDNWKLEGF